MTDRVSEISNLKTVIMAKTRISGEIVGQDEFYFEGEFEGKIKLDSLLFLKKSGKIKGNVEAENIVVEGELEGDVIARNKIEVRAAASFNGTVMCKHIAIEEGAFFQGEVKMKDGKKADPTYFKEKRKDQLKK